MTLSKPIALPPSYILPPAIWCGVGLAIAALLAGVAWAGNPFLVIPAAICFGLVLLLSWLLLAGYGFMRGWKLRQRPSQAIVAAGAPWVAIALVVLLALPVAHVTLAGLIRVTLLTKRSSYEAIIVKAKTGAFQPGDSRQSYDGTDFILDEGPPMRLAFPLPGGVLDNWSGIVFDPTGDVTLARGFAKGGDGFTAPPAVHALFGGDIVTCDHLSGDFYYCTFT